VRHLARRVERQPVARVTVGRLLDGAPQLGVLREEFCEVRGA
jgi:hypothetical protein